MRQFMRDDVVNQMQRQLDQAPVEVNDATAVAATPAGLGPRQTEWRHRYIQFLRIDIDALPETGDRLLAVPGHDEFFDVLRTELRHR